MPRAAASRSRLARASAAGCFSHSRLFGTAANNRILALPGVRHVETSIAVKTLKYDYRAAKITPSVRRTTKKPRPA